MPRRRLVAFVVRRLTSAYAGRYNSVFSVFHSLLDLLP